ncbi:ABC transporter ATP-binding protein [Clostridium sp. Cult1]|nr:ABC transporter ATP-binding protein [Clostridium sp. Cult1]
MKLARKAIESQYKGLCTIYEYIETEDPDTGETIVSPEPAPVHENIPCKLSKKTINPTNQTEMANTIQYSPVLFINPDIEIKAGSNIVITQNGVTRKFVRSGEPFPYETHQEIVLQRTDTA